MAGNIKAGLLATSTMVGSAVVYNKRKREDEEGADSRERRNGDNTSSWSHNLQTLSQNKTQANSLQGAGQISKHCETVEQMMIWK